MQASNADTGAPFGFGASPIGPEFPEDGRGFGPFGEGCEPWYWNKKVGEAGIMLHQGLLPPVIVVDETWVKVGGKEAWIYVALDPRRDLP